MSLTLSVLLKISSSTHDGWNLLRMTGFLEYDKVLGALFYLQGWLYLFLSLCFFVFPEMVAPKQLLTLGSLLKGAVPLGLRD